MLCECEMSTTNPRALIGGKPHIVPVSFYSLFSSLASEETPKTKNQAGRDDATPPGGREGEKSGSSWTNCPPKQTHRVCIFCTMLVAGKTPKPAARKTKTKKDK